MIHYIIQTIAFQLFFLLVYDVFLKKETFFNWNRLYLLSTVILSLILPFIKINSFKEVVPQDYIVSLPEIILGQSSTNTNNVVLLKTIVLEQNTMSLWEIIFYIGLCVSLCLFLFKVFKILALIIKNPKQSLGNIVLVELLNSTAAFSFFHYIFLGERIKVEDKEAILKHELIHTKEKHTLDLLFFEVLRILLWFNPLVYMYQNRIATLHEFIADANAVKHQDKNEYYQNLLAQVFETKKISFINTFFKQSLIKKRIVMLSKTKSKQINLLKYVLLIPMVFGMLIYTSAEAQEKQKDVKDLSQYTYTLKSEEKEMSAETKMIHNNYVAFLLSNPNYVSWAQFDEINKKVTYSVHSKDEKVPENLSKSGVNFKDGRSYIMYINWPAPPAPPRELTEEEKKEKEDELLKLKEEYKNAKEVPFAVIDQVPIFPGCENLSKEAQKRCISNKISKFVQRKFNTDLASDLGLTGRQHVNVIFKIDTNGDIKGVRSRAPHPELEKEAARVIKTLPKMIPGKHKGKNVIVPYSLPIVFQVQDAIEEKEAELIPLDEVIVSFAVIENVPVFPGCEDLTSNAEKKNCMSKSITEFVAKNFNTKKASEYGLSGRQRINVIFKIDAKGNIVGVRSRAAHPALEAEAIRVISSLPKMKPGIHRGKAVTVPYSLPIIFDVQGTQLLDEVSVVTYNDDTLGGTALPFVKVDKAPILPECEAIEGEEAKKTCTTNGIQKYVAKNFNTDLAKSLGLSRQQRINVAFKITKKGHIVIQKSRATHPDLEAEAIRVIKLIPKLIPGEHKGKKVDVLYSLPIIFSTQE